MMEARDYIAKQIEALQNATTATEITEQADYFVNILKDIVSKTIELTAYRKLGTPEEIKTMQEWQRPLVCIRETQRATIKELEAENERLNEQLKNSVQLPCKVGARIYWVFETDRNGEILYEIDEGVVKWVSVEDDGTYWIYVKYNSGLTYQHHIEKTTQEDNLYQSLSEAEARLKEQEEWK